jgi:ribokinase
VLKSGREERLLMICVVGSSNTDLVVKSRSLPAPGETVLGGEFNMFPGGKGANQAVAAARGHNAAGKRGAARAGGKMAFIAALGDDDFGRRAFANFQREGIDVSCARLHKGAVSALRLLAPHKRNPMRTSTLGTGQLIRAAVRSCLAEEI